MKLGRNFTKGRMNKLFDERLIPDGEYIDAMNIRLGSTEESELGAIENTKGNEKLTTLEYSGTALSTDAVCLGSLDDSVNNVIYWCVHDPSNTESATGICDMIVSYDVKNDILIYNVISTDDGSGVTTTLNFDPLFRVNAMDKIDDLLFINDYNNPPRRFNVREIYIEPTVLDINLIVQPPAESPIVEPIKQNGQESYLDTRFLTFAYRYKYKDGEYSALSQFSKIAFAPNDFKLNYETFQNDGMTNAFNSAIISMETGSSNIVGLDLVFKFSNSSILNVVEKYDKDDLGWSDNSSVSVTFTNKKVYTTIGSSELFRLFDNVPHKVQAQTIMDNRLDFGNYTDGYNVVDENGQDCRIIFTPELISESIERVDLVTEKSEALYSIDGVSPQTIDNTVVTVDMSSVSSNLDAGSRVTISISLAHWSYVSTADLPITTPKSILLNISLTLSANYASVAALVASPEFEAAIGETTYTPISDCGTIDAGNSLTDQTNCGSTTPTTPSPGWIKDNSGITAADEGIAISTSSDTFSLTMIAMRYDSVSSPGTYLYEYFEVVSSSVSFYKEDIGRSLHSKRDYEVAIVYMDEYSRSTTALVSSDNTVYVDPNKSISKNNIRTTIPATQKPPYWATKYKFVLKPSEIDYETIYSDLFFNDPTNGTTYFLLEGDNQNKCSEGDVLRVKKDINGSILNDVEVTVIDISAKQKDFLNNNDEVLEPSGVYMQVKNASFSTDYLDGYLKEGYDGQVVGTLIPVFEENPTYDPSAAISSVNVRYKPWEILAGSLIHFELYFEGEDTAGNYQNYEYNKRYTASHDYSNLYDFIQGEGIQFDTGIVDSDGTPVPNTYYDNLFDILTDPSTENYISGIGDVAVENHRFQVLWQNPSSATGGDTSAGKMWFGIRSRLFGTGLLPVSRGLVRVVTGGNLFVFETIPAEADPNVFYESSDNHDITGGFHTGDIQTQTASLPAIVDLTFFDCFSFGNGVESYKIGDGLANPSFRLGERFYAVSEEDYKEAHRYADITYSGIYNAETNVNRLNEFNLSLANFKTLEKSFGAIRVLDAKASDILVLQEDKVSYVLSSKSLLSSPSGGGAIAAIPEVLGTVISRIENYGISNNPESYAEWGFNKYFTDTKRGAVIKLTGSGHEEKLTVVSDMGMKSWFRDYMRLTPDTQKLGGYDPYMGEYVLAGNLVESPSSPFTTTCGGTTTVSTSDTSTEWDVLLAPGSGTMTIAYTIGILPMGETVTVNVTYNGLLFSSGAVTSGGSFFIPKTVDVDIAHVEVILSSSFETTYAVLVGCAVEDNPQITQVTLAGSDAGVEYIHNDFFWTQGSYISPTQSNLVLLQNTADTLNVSQYQTFEGNAGAGMIPPSSGTQVTIRVQSTKKDFDNFTFGSSSLLYVLSAVEYPNTQQGIADMLVASTTLQPLVNPTTGIYYYDITYTQTQQFSPYIYLIYDYR